MRESTSSGNRALRALRCAVTAALTFAVFLVGSVASAAPALWKAERGDAKVYIFGTVHMLRPDTDWLDARIQSRFDEADTLYLEIAEIHGTPYDVGAVIRDQGAYPRGESLSYVLGERTYRELQLKMSELGAPAFALYRMRPWYAHLVLMSLMTSDAGGKLNHGADVTLYRMALKAKKEVEGMETLEDHFLTLSGVPEDDQVRMLEQTLRGYGTSTSEIDPIIDAWMNGDPQALDDIMRAELKDEPEFYDRLLTDRNRKWLTKTKQILRGKGTTFIAVGAGHLAGPQSLILMMRRDGIKVTRE